MLVDGGVGRGGLDVVIVDDVLFPIPSIHQLGRVFLLFLLFCNGTEGSESLSSSVIVYVLDFVVLVVVVVSVVVAVPWLRNPAGAVVQNRPNVPGEQWPCP